VVVKNDATSAAGHAMTIIKGVCGDDLRLSPDAPAPLVRKRVMG
jgi:hypothetical protein